jgi:hypothetical protein
MLILYYSQKNDTLLSYELNNCKRYLKKAFLFDKNEKDFIEAFAKLNNTKEDAKIFANVVSKIKESKTIITEKSVLNGFIIQWLEEKSGL